jgi:hypothetical protein
MTLDELEATVARMRALGVTRFGEIELGPAPLPPAEDPPKMTEEERKDASLETMLRSSGLRVSESFRERWKAATDPAKEFIDG